MKQQRSTVKTRNQPEKRQDGDAVGRPSCRSSFLRDPGAKFLGGKLNKQKNSLNFASTCLKVVDTRRLRQTFLLLPSSPVSVMKDPLPCPG